MIGFWLFVALLYAASISWVAMQPGERINLQMAIIWQGAYYLAWIPVTVLVWRVTREWQPARLGWTGYFAAHLALGLVIATVHTAGVVGAAWPFAAERDSPWAVLGRQLRGRVHLDLLIYAAIVGVGQAIAFHERFRARQLAAARLEAELTQARLHALRAQLQPHFLFNSLHSIASLARVGDNAAVVRLIAGLSDLLRHGLDTSTERQSLADEMHLVEKYLDIQRVRFGDRLSADIEVSPAAAPARVPPLVVQPLVENALRHGLAPQVGPGAVRVRARRDGRWVVVDVEDTGAGLPAGWNAAASNGTGLRNLSARLEAEFGGDYALDVAPRPGGGTVATVRMPGGWA